MRPTLEGGDVLVLRDDILAIGYSERTEKTTIERLAESFKAQRSPIKRIFVVAIPPARSYMHLDTVFTVISRDECLVYGPMILPDGAGGGRRLRVRPDEARDHLDDGEGSALGAADAEDGPEADPLRRETIRSPSAASSGPTAPMPSRWPRASSSSTTATSARPRSSREAGYRVVDEADLLLGNDRPPAAQEEEVRDRLAAHELSRARGGPRCMAMPLEREDVAP